MKRILPIFLFAFLTQTAVSQDAVYDKNTDTTTPRKAIRLKKYSYDDPQLNKIAAIEILPVQWDTTRLGFVQVGLANRKIEALPAAPYERFLQDYINEQYGSRLSPRGAHLLWAVKDLRINEKSFSMYLRGWQAIHIDFGIRYGGHAEWHGGNFAP